VIRRVLFRRTSRARSPAASVPGAEIGRTNHWRKPVFIRVYLRPSAAKNRRELLRIHLDDRHHTGVFMIQNMAMKDERARDLRFPKIHA
jgi:hypothetical protein